MDARAVRVLVLEQEHQRFKSAIEVLDPRVEIFSAAQAEDAAAWAPSCPIWLGAPDSMAELLRRGFRPIWIQSSWAGIAPLLVPDLPRDYMLSKAVGVFGQFIAEYVLVYVLAHERQLFERAVAQTRQQWNCGQPGSLEGKTVLIVGCGDIGTAIAKFLRPFGVRILGVARQPREIESVEAVGSLTELPKMLQSADYVINLLPDSPSTQSIFNATIFSSFKPSAIFINAGRGTAVVERDLLEALNAGRPLKAIIDVCRQEPLPADHPFWSAHNLLLTGHTAGMSNPRGVAALFLDNLGKYLAGLRLRGQVDLGAAS